MTANARAARPDDGRNQFPKVRSMLLGLIRRGPREVLWALPGLGLGNFLYLWLWATAESSRERRVLEQPEMRRWLDIFPSVRGLTIPRDTVRLTDRRVTTAASRFDEQIDRAELADFVQRYLLTAPLFTDVRQASDGTCDEITVHVRRGSYYSDPVLYQHYSMDIVGFVNEGVRRLLARNPGLTSVRVLTDDLSWVREHLACLEDLVPEVRFGGVGSSDAEDFRDLARARYLVLSNSTFSYWAGYISNVIHGDNHADVVVPRFHLRSLDGTREMPAWHVDPRWDVVEALPGGWRPKEVDEE